MRRERDKTYGADEIGPLMAALCDRLAEVLPQKQFEVTVEHRYALRIRGVGSRLGDTVWLSPIALWRSSAPADRRLQLFLEAVSRRVQKFVGRPNRPWPTGTANPKVSIDEDSILVWWGGVSEDEAVVALRPIPRQEIGCINGLQSSGDGPDNIW